MYILSVGVAKFTCTDGIRWGLCVKYVERKYLNGNILTMPQVIIKLAPFFEPDRPISLFVRRQKIIAQASVDIRRMFCAEKQQRNKMPPYLKANNFAKQFIIYTKELVEPPAPSD